LAPGSASVSTVTRSPATVPADNTTTSTITVTLKDAGGNPVSGKAVSLSPDHGSSTIDQTSVTTNSSGVAQFTVHDGATESVVYTATDTTDSITLNQTASVFFSAVDPANSSVVASPTSITADGTTTSTITVTLRDSQNQPVSGKSASLSQALVGGGA